MVSTRWLDELPCGARRKKENAAIGSSASKSGLSQSENAFRCCRCVVADESDVQKHVSMDGLIRQIGILPEWTAKSTSLLGRWRQIDEKGSWQGLLKASGVPALVIPLLISTPGTEPDIEYEHGKEGALKRRCRTRVKPFPACLLWPRQAATKSPRAPWRPPTPPGSHPYNTKSHDQIT